MNLKCLHFATYSISVLYFFPCLENLWLKIFFTNYVIVPSLGQSLLLYYTSYLGIRGCCWWFIRRGNNKNFFDFFDCSTFPTVIFLQLKFCSFYFCSNLFNFIYFLCLQLIQHMILECQNNIFLLDLKYVDFFCLFICKVVSIIDISILLFPSFKLPFRYNVLWLMIIMVVNDYRSMLDNFHRNKKT